MFEPVAICIEKQLIETASKKLNPISLSLSIVLKPEPP
jgi:hypothetical protein